jgi:ankyrin repeat protein
MDQSLIPDSKSQVEDLHKVAPSIIKEDAVKEYTIIVSNRLERIERVCSMLIDPEYNEYTQNPKRINDQGYNWLMYVCKKSNHLFLNLILEDKSCDINLQNAEGWTALHIAIEENSTKCVKLLIKYGCDINILTKDAMTPLMLACMYSFTEIAKYIMDQKECKRDFINKNKQTALMIACKNKSYDIIEGFIKYDDCGYDLKDEKNRYANYYVDNVLNVPMNKINCILLLKQKIIDASITAESRQKKEKISLLQMFRKLVNSNDYKPVSQSEDVVIES